jgi:hypothetical protein
LDELLAAALPRIVELAVTADHAELANLAGLALQLAPSPALPTRSPTRCPNTACGLPRWPQFLTSQQVNLNRADARDGDPGTTNRLGVSLNDSSLWLAHPGWREEAPAAIQEGVTIRELLARWPDAYQHDLWQSLRLAAWLE